MKNFKLLLSIALMIPIFLGCPKIPEQSKSDSKLDKSISLPIDFRDLVLKEFNSMTEKEKKEELKMQFDEYYELRKEMYINRQLLNSVVVASETNLCDNGTFEGGNINAGDWLFTWGGANYQNDNNNYTASSGTNLVNSGLFDFVSPTDNNHNTEVHHQVVSSGDDPTFSSLDRVWIDNPSENSYSLRLGNKGRGMGFESISKVITVTPENWTLTFSYAMVVQNPGHSSGQNPSFVVNITNQTSGENYNDLVDLGGGDNSISSVHALLTPPLPATLRWKDWECITVDLSSLEGETIRIEFDNRDCLQGGHYGYTYLDNICLSCDGIVDGGGGIEVNWELSGDCTNPGNVCIDYSLPDGNNPSLGLELEIIQNGITIVNLSSPTITSGSTYCFEIDELNTNGFDYSLAGFDYKITGVPSIDTFTLTPKVIGNSAEGYIEGINNDCIKYTIPICCPPMDTSLLADLFNHVVLGSGLNSPFELEFNNNSYFSALWQSYVDYIDLTYPIVEDLAIHIRLIDAHDNNNPNTPLDVYSPMVAPGTETWVWFQPGQGGTIFGDTNVFNATLIINHWYKIHTGIYTVPEDIFKNKDCQASYKIFYRVQLLGGKLIGELSDGNRVFKRIDLEKSGLLKRKE